MKFLYASGARPLEGYTIKRGVGIGGFGEVYFATSDAGKEVALKRIQRNLDVEIRGVTQCLNLKHPNLISIFDIKYDDLGEAWIVMEYVAGDSLKEVIDRNPHGMPQEDVMFWFRGIAAGVACLHDHGIVHRDLKPGNIFRDEGFVKIGDYGLSKFISCSRRSGQTESVGTFHYMAPEIGRGVYGKEIDIYALGIILCEMLTGRVPFEGESSQEIIMKHLTADADLSRVPARFRRVVERALFKDPAQRHRSVAELLQAVELGERDGAGPQVRGATGPVISAVAIGPPPAARPATVVDSFAPHAAGSYDSTSPGKTLGGAADVPPAVGDPSADREPIAAALSTAYQQFVHWWTATNLGTPIKVALVVGTIMFLVFNSHWLIPVALGLGVAYLAYIAVRTVMVSAPGVSQQSGVATSVAAAPPPSSPRRHTRRLARVHWREQTRAALRRKPIGQRLGELTGSWLMAAIVSAVLGLIVIVAGGRELDAAVDTWTFYTWLTVTSVLGSWVVLGLAKLWEGTDGDDILRRFVLMVAGLAVGGAAFVLKNYLTVRLTTAEMFNVLELPQDLIPQGMYAADGTPGLTVFLAYFATLFVLIRWWRQVDPLRKTRFSLGATMLCALVAMLIPWQIPWGFPLALTMSMAMQLSSPWTAVDQHSRAHYDALDV